MCNLISYFTPFEFFHTSFNWSLSVGEFLQISWTLLGIPADLRKYFGQDVFEPSFDFHLLQSLFKTFGKCFKHTNYNCYNWYLNVPQFVCFFSSRVRTRYLFIFSLCFIFIQWSRLLLLLLLSLLFYTFESFSHLCEPMVSHWSLSNSKSLQVSRTLPSILTDLNNAVVLTVSTRPVIPKSSRPFINPLVTVLRPPITIGITVTFMFHSFFQFPSKVQVLNFLFAFFQFYPVVNRDSKVHNPASSRFFLGGGVFYYYKVKPALWSSG